jgi:hypothetical protein
LKVSLNTINLTLKTHKDNVKMTNDPLKSVTPDFPILSTMICVLLLFVKEFPFNM